MAGNSSDWPVHQLWPLPESNEKTELDVVLFHGLQLTPNYTGDCWSSTWTQRGNDEVCWPEKWLPFDLGEPVRILSMSFNAHVLTSPHGHVSEIAHNLFESLMDRRYEWRHPIVLIGHSFGGLVLKSLVVQLERASTIRNRTDSLTEAKLRCAKLFLRNVRGVAFYAVPHAGSRNFTDYVNKLLRCNIGHHPGIMDNIQPWQRDMEQLSVDFDDIASANKINIYAFCEGRPMEAVGMLVDFSSAQRSARYNFYKVEDADHMEVCKPPSREHPSYRLLLQLINTCKQAARECDQALQEVHDLPPTFGLESYVQRVETLVTSAASDEAPRYVGVWGMGGVGKTLLVQRVYRSAKVRGHFEGANFIWRTVGQTPDIMTLYRSLSEELGLEPELYANEEDYKLQLQSQYRHRRVFLVLDDVWKDKEFDSLDLAKGKGSVTLLTTRSQYLLERGNPCINQLHMLTLSENDSWSLFCVHAFRSPQNVPSELKTVAQSMAEECRGLPLALKVIGRAMFGKTSPTLQWERVRKKLCESRMQEKVVGELYERLKLGYDVLSEDDDRLKDCFLYLAAFPEDCQIHLEDIMWHWIGKGLIPGNVGDDPRADAFTLLDKLRERSFIELYGEVGSDGSNLLFKLHDVMRDLAFYILEKENGIPAAKEFYLYQAGRNLEKFPKEWKQKPEVCVLSLQRNKLKRLPKRFCAPKLVSLLLGENPIKLIPETFLSNLPNLKVLNLSGGRFDFLPEELGNLKNLLWLDLKDCVNLEELPESVRKLHALKHLNVCGCTEMSFLPSGIGDLTSLQVLNAIRCDAITMSYSDDLGASFEEICALNSLTELFLCSLRFPGAKLLQHISALSNLKILNLGIGGIQTLPAEMAYWFMQLETLHLCSSIQLQALPTSFTSCDAFPALINFAVHMCRKLVKFPEVEKGALRKLRTLELCCCESLQSLPLSLNRLTNLSILSIVNCGDTLGESCRTNCEKSSIWRKFDIQYGRKSGFVRLKTSTVHTSSFVNSNQCHCWARPT